MNLREDHNLINKKFLIALISILIFITFCSIFFIDNHSLVAHDESLYGSRAKLILDTQNWLTPFDSAHKKTIGSYWLIALSLKLFGINEFSARLPSYIFSLLSILVLFKIVKLLSNSQVAIISILVLPSSYLWFAYSNYCSPDTLYIFFNLLGIFNLLKIHQDLNQEIKNKQFFLSGLFLSLPFFFRSYMQLLPLISISPLIFLKLKKLNSRNLRSLIFGFLFGLIPLIIYYLVSYKTYGIESLIKPYLLLHSKTFTENNLFQGFLFYPRNIFIFCLPFSIFLFNGTKYILKSQSKEIKILFLVTPLINIVTLMFTASKYSHYGLFVIPLLASNASFGIYESLNNFSGSSKLTLRIFGGFNLIISSSIFLSLLFRSKIYIFNKLSLIDLFIMCIFCLVSIYLSFTFLSKVRSRVLNINKLLSLLFIQIIFFSFLFSKGIVGNPNNQFKSFIVQSEINELITNNRIFLIGKLDDKLLNLLKFYLPMHKTLDKENIPSKESIYGIISDEEFKKLNKFYKSQFTTIKKYKGINFVKIN